MIPDEDLVPVTDPNEIEPGVTLVVKPCRTHHRTCVIMVFAKGERLPFHHWPGAPPETDALCRSPVSFETSHVQGSSCYCDAIAERRLFRLRPEPLLGHRLRLSVKVGDRTVVMTPVDPVDYEVTR